MKLCQVTGPLAVERRLAGLDQVAFVALRDDKGQTLAAADPLGVQTGDQVLVSEGGAPAALGRNCPADALVVCVLAHRE